MIAMKMKTNKQQSVILMLLVIPTILTLVTTTTTQQAFAKSGSSRRQTDTSRDTQGQNDNGVPIQVQASGQTTHRHN
jgi:hypothetical protein